MIISDIIQHRLYNHHIYQHSFKKPDALVAWLGAVQAQDYTGAKWSVGLRLPSATAKEIEDAFSDKKIVRTWALRGTLHIISSSDVWWLLELLGPVVIGRNAALFRKQELDDSTFKKINAVIKKIMSGGNQFTRKELFAKLEEHKISTAGLRGSHILYKAALEKIICLGTLSGKQETYTLLEEWLPKPASISRDEALRELARRYFQSHGPATLQDFGWWSGLSAADSKIGFDLIKKALDHTIVEDKSYWFFQSEITTKKQTQAILLQGYDEYFVGYKDRSIVLDQKHKKSVEPGNGFSPVVIVDGQIKGTWRRTIKKDNVSIETNFFSPLNAAQKEAVVFAGEQYRAFLNMSQE